MAQRRLRIGAAAGPPDHELDSLIHELSVRHNTPKSSIAVHASGPNTFTLSLNHGTANLESVSS